MNFRRTRMIHFQSAPSKTAQGFRPSRARTERTGPGHLYLIDPARSTMARPAVTVYRYRMIYPDVATVVGSHRRRDTPCFSRDTVLSEVPTARPKMAQAFQIAHRRLDNGAGALEADVGMFSVLAELFCRHGSAIILPVETREKTAVYQARGIISMTISTWIWIGRTRSYGRF